MFSGVMLDVLRKDELSPQSLLLRSVTVEVEGAELSFKTKTTGVSVLIFCNLLGISDSLSLDGSSTLLGSDVYEQI